MTSTACATSCAVVAPEGTPTTKLPHWLTGMSTLRARLCPTAAAMRGRDFAQQRIGDDDADRPDDDLGLAAGDDRGVLARSRARRPGAEHGAGGDGVGAHAGDVALPFALQCLDELAADAAALPVHDEYLHGPSPHNTISSPDASRQRRFSRTGRPVMRASASGVDGQLLFVVAHERLAVARYVVL